MSTAKGWAAPGFTLLALMALAGCAAGGGGTGPTLPGGTGTETAGSGDTTGSGAGSGAGGGAGEEAGDGAGDGAGGTTDTETTSGDTTGEDAGAGDTASDDTGTSDTGSGDTGPSDTGSGSAGSGDEGSGSVGSDDTGSTETASSDPTSGSGSAGDAGGTTTPPVLEVTVPNPYATAGSSEANKLGRLFVFGDSYSDPLDPDRSCTPRGGKKAKSPCLDPASIWSEKLVTMAGGSPDDVITFARGKASAAATNVYYKADLDPDGDGIDSNGNDKANTFKTQVDQWKAWKTGGGVLKSNDLTIVYMGYNDINSNAPLWKSASDYGVQLDALIKGGATGKDRRVFVTLVHDWGTTPSGNAFGTDRTRQLNRRLSNLVNHRDKVVAVDMFTVFKRIFADPARYGFTNMTTPDPANADSTALYFDNRHFGARGQEIVAKVYNHYLTRGWDWANTLAAGDEATARLKQDIESGLVLALDAAGQEHRRGLTTFFVGDHEAAMRDANAEETLTGARASFTRMAEGGAADAGVGLNWALDDKTMLGMVASRYGSSNNVASGTGTSQLDTKSDALSLYLTTSLGGIDLRTTASFGDDHYQRRNVDDLLGESNAASHGGRTVALTQTASTSYKLPGAWLQPWVSLSQTQREIDGFTIADPYVSDLTYSNAQVDDTVVSLGLKATGNAIAVGSNGSLKLTGGVSYTRGLVVDDYEVTVSEAALDGFGQKETMQRGDLETVAFTLGSVLDIGQALELSAGYTLTDQAASGTDHAVTARMSYRF